MKLKVLVHPAEEGGFWAEVPALPGCVSEGDSFDETLANIREAAEGWLEVSAERAADDTHCASRGGRTVRSVSGKHFCNVLRKHNWELKRVKGSHHIFGKSGNATILTVPVHGNKALKTGTLKKLLRDAGLTANDL